MLAVDPGYVIASVVVIHHGVPHVRNGLSVASVLDVVDQRIWDVLHEDEVDIDETGIISVKFEKTWI